MEGGVRELIAEFISNNTSRHDMSRYEISALSVLFCRLVADRKRTKDIPSTAAALSFGGRLQPKNDNCRVRR